MAYSVRILRRAQRGVSHLPRDVVQQLRGAIEQLALEPRPHGCRKLTGRDAWRIRVGNYRVIYEIDDDTSVITVLDIGHRSDIYR